MGDSLPTVPQVKQWAPGMIKHAVFHNFLIYEHAEFSPHPGFNFIMGPNGAGKSAIVCGLALGLGGKPSSLGRASKIQDFVRRGTPDGYIEITLHKPKPDEDGDVTLRRELRSDKSTSDYYINGRKARLTDVLELVNGVNIKVDNPCQFLAQEKVSSFTKYTAEELLIETEKAIQDSKLFDDHQQLIEDQKNKESDQEVLRLQRQLVQKENELRACVSAFERFQEREKLQHRIKVLRTRMEVRQFDDSRRIEQTERKVLQEMKAKVEKLLEKVRPAQEILEQAVAERDAAQTHQETIQQSICRHDAVRLDHGKKVRNATAEVSTKVAQVRKTREQLESLRSDIQDDEQQIVAFQKELEELPSDADINEQTADLRQKAAEHKARADAFRAEADDASVTLDSISNQELVEVDRKLRKLQDETGLRQRRLFKKGPNGANAQRIYSFVQRNRTKFRRPEMIHGPIIYYLDGTIPDQAHVDYLEMAVNAQLRWAWVCGDSQDLVTLNKFIMEQGLKVSVHQRAPDLPLHVQRRGDIDYLKTMGVEAWMDELLPAMPDAVRNVLIEVTSMNLNAVTRKEIDPNNIGNVLAQRHQNTRGCLRLYSPKTCYGVKFSDYGDRAALTQPSDTRRARDLKTGRGGATGDAEVRRERKLLQARSQQLLHQKSELMQLINAKKAAEKTERDASQSLLEKARKKSSATQRRKRIERTIRQRQDAVKIARTRKVPALERAIKERVADALKCVKQHTEMLNATLQTVLTFQRLHQQRLLAQVSQKRCVFFADKAYEDMIEARKEHADEERALKEQQEKTQRLIDNTRKLKETLKRGLFLKMKDEIRQLLDDEEETWITRAMSASVLEDSLCDHEAQVNALEIDEVRLRKYQDAKAAVEELRRRKEQEEKAVREKNDKLERIRTEWLPNLKEMVEKIRVAYKKCFADIGCSGDVKLIEHPTDYSKYKLQLYVSYRRGEIVKPLSADHNSGGERSVATMLFLLSLQDVTTCPFRVVDEINQGMDSSNERQVLDQIIRASGPSDDGRSKPQYFVVSPKLLPDLEFQSHCAVHVVFNGVGCVKQGEWGIPSFTQRHKITQGERQLTQEELQSTMPSQYTQHTQHAQQQHDSENSQRLSNKRSRRQMSRNDVKNEPREYD
ncbi:MAG: hypothetical protein MHM6MM_003152 [Cercozoa sp. M6MM]